MIFKVTSKMHKNYKNAIKIKPDYADAYNNMGSAYKELGDLEEHLNAYQKSIITT